MSRPSPRDRSVWTWRSGRGGVPRGRIIEIFGPESGGKTTLALHIVAEAQKQNGLAAFIDAEHALDVTYARKIGVNTDDLLISQPDTGEQALEIAETLVRSGALDVLVVDSVAALVPKAEIEGEMGDAQMGLQARLMSQALRKLTGSISKSKTTVIFINQLRMKIGVFFGNPETTTGGNALKFYATMRLDIRKVNAIKQGQDVIGFRTRVKVVKNKVAPPFRETEFDIIFGEGISKEGDVLDLAADKGIIEKSGAWYSYKGDRLGQGRDNTRIFLKENPEILTQVEAEVREKLGREAEGGRGQGRTEIDDGRATLREKAEAEGLPPPDPPGAQRKGIARKTPGGRFCGDGRRSGDSAVPGTRLSRTTRRSPGSGRGSWPSTDCWETAGSPSISARRESPRSSAGEAIAEVRGGDRRGGGDRDAPRKEGPARRPIAGMDETGKGQTGCRGLMGKGFPTGLIFRQAEKNGGGRVS